MSTEKSRDLGIPILVRFESDDEHSNRMRSEVLEDSLVSQWLNRRFVVVEVDVQTPFGGQLARRYGLSGLPTYQIVDSLGISHFTLAGYHEKSKALDAFEEGIADYERYGELSKKFVNKTATREESMAYIAHLARDPQLKGRSTLQASAYVESFTAEDAVNPELGEFMITFGSSKYSNPIFEVVRSHPASVRAAIGDEDWNRYIGAVYSNEIRESIERRDSARFHRLKSEVVPLFALDPPEIAEAILTSEKLFFGNTNNPSSYRRVVEDYYADGNADNRLDYWYQSAYEVLENYSSPAMVSMVFPWLDRQIEMQERVFDSHIMYAYGKGIMGNRQAAVAQANRALQLASTPSERELAREVLRVVESASYDQ